MSAVIAIAPPSTTPHPTPTPTPIPPTIPKRSHRDIIAGAGGGVVAVVLGQPFDLVKAHLQTCNSSNVGRVVTDVVRNEGPLAFYKGALLPFLGVGAAVSIQFSVFHTARQHLESLNGGSSPSPTASTTPLSLPQNYLAAAARGTKREDLPWWTVAPCGSLAGIAWWVGSYPLDVVKTRLQSDGFGVGMRYPGGAWAAVQDTWRRGGYMGFWRGLSPTLVRTVLSSGGTFATAEKIRSWLA